MDDVVERIKSLRYVHVPQASQLFEEAVAEITRLRNDNAKLRGIIRLQDAAVRSGTATLADAEREAIQYFIDGGPDDVVTDPPHLAALEGLLARSATSTMEGGE